MWLSEGVSASQTLEWWYSNCALVDPLCWSFLSPEPWELGGEALRGQARAWCWAPSRASAKISGGWWWPWPKWNSHCVPLGEKPRGPDQAPWGVSQPSHMQAGEGGLQKHSQCLSCPSSPAQLRGACGPPPLLATVLQVSPHCLREQMGVKWLINVLKSKAASALAGPGFEPWAFDLRSEVHVYLYCCTRTSPNYMISTLVHLEKEIIYDYLETVLFTLFCMSSICR